MGSLVDKAIEWPGMQNAIFSVDLLGVELNGEAGVNDGVSKGKNYTSPWFAP